jgi:hypothetical protein
VDLSPRRSIVYWPEENEGAGADKVSNGCLGTEIAPPKNRRGGAAATDGGVEIQRHGGAFVRQQCRI